MTVGAKKSIRPLNDITKTRVDTHTVIFIPHTYIVTHAVNVMEYFLFCYLCRPKSHKCLLDFV